MAAVTDLSPQLEEGEQYMPGEPTHGEIMQEIRGVGSKLDLHIETSSQWRDSFDRRLSERPKGIAELTFALLTHRPWLALAVVAIVLVLGTGGIEQAAEHIGHIIRLIGGQ